MSVTFFQLLSWIEVQHVLVPFRIRLLHLCGRFVIFGYWAWFGDSLALSLSLLSQVALFFHYKGLQMVKIIEGRHLGSAQSIDRWLADKKSGKKARTDTAHTYFVEQSRLQILLLFFGWCFQSCKAYYMWGEYVVCRWTDNI